jgi:Zn-dependent peptidase ImmA (M78 family)/DNA-binding XRE family transcriptional regulator
MDKSDQALIMAVKAKREAAGLSLRALANEVGVSFSTLARIERGDGSPDNNSKIRLIEWLGPDAEAAGLALNHVALVHFRAMKNVQSGTVQALLRAAICLRREHTSGDDGGAEAAVGGLADAEPHAETPKDQLEGIAERFRADLGLKDGQPLDSLRIRVEGIYVAGLTQTGCLDARTMRRLRDEACSEWSAMSVPLNADAGKWVVLLNDCHTLERQRVTLLEEYWHILMGHRLTKVARVAEAYGRTYDRTEEHDAYYLASASLLPKGAVQKAVRQGQSSRQIAARFGTSAELVDYRIKRLGLWREHLGRAVVLTTE